MNHFDHAAPHAGRSDSRSQQNRRVSPLLDVRPLPVREERTVLGLNHLKIIVIIIMARLKDSSKPDDQGTKVRNE